MYDQNTFQLDGGNNSNDMDGSMTDYTGSYGHNAFAGFGNPPSGVLPTPVDTIEEFKVATAGQTADFNGSSGSQVSVVTKRGTNQFHGTGVLLLQLERRGRGQHVGQQPHAQRRPRLHADPDHPQQPIRLYGGRSDAAEVSGAARRTSSSATKVSTSRNRRLSTSRCRPTRCARA